MHWLPIGVMRDRNIPDWLPYRIVVIMMIIMQHAACSSTNEQDQPGGHHIDMTCTAATAVMTGQFLFQALLVGMLARDVGEIRA
jgi:hypothetical protein